MENLLLTNLTEVPTPYAIFESRGQEDNTAKNYLVLSFHGKQVYSFGRTTFDSRQESADITEDDIHMSRLNTELKYSNGIHPIIQEDSTSATVNHFTVPF